MIKRAYNFIDLSGKKFGKLLVIKDTGKNYISSKGRRCPIFLCKCECGEEKEISSNSLRAGSKSCSCSKVGWPGARVDDAEFAQIFARYKIEAKNRNLEFFLSREEFMILIKLPCFYCCRIGTNFVRHKRLNGEVRYYNGIDRVDNSEGYKTNNCVPCCKKCNSDKKSVSKNIIEKAFHFLQAKGKL